MLKKLDKFILSRFLGPFFLAYAVVTFIFLIQHLLRYFKHFVGKDLGWGIFFELFSNFALMLTPVTLPLAVLLSSLMSFGSLGEHSELTAIKSSGISLLRILRPVAGFVLLTTMGAVYFNDVISPEANLYAYSLLYDIKQKKPTLEFKEGAFYDGLPGYSIRVEKKSGPDGQELEGLMIYNHSARQGNTDLIMAERGRMYTINNGDYLVLEMLNGNRYTDMSAEKGRRHEQEFLTNEFDSSKIVFSMESFGLKETKKELFKGHNMMKTANQLISEWDSVQQLMEAASQAVNTKAKAYYYYQFPPEETEAASVKQHLEDEEVKKGGRPIDTKPQITQQPSTANGGPPPMLSQTDTTKKKADPLLTTRKEVWEQIALSTPKNQEDPLLPFLERKGTPPKGSLIEEAMALGEIIEEPKAKKAPISVLPQPMPDEKKLPQEKTSIEEKESSAEAVPKDSQKDTAVKKSKVELSKSATPIKTPNLENIVLAQKAEKLKNVQLNKLKQQALANQQKLDAGDNAQPTASNDQIRKMRKAQASEEQSQQLPSKKNSETSKSDEQTDEEELRFRQQQKAKQEKKSMLKPKAKPWHEEMNYRTLNMAWSKANGVKISLEDLERRIERYQRYMVEYDLELQSKYARAIAVFIMFLIGAPLGAIIKKGGLGVPILISIIFFIIYYITTLSGSKLAKAQSISVELGAWGGDVLLLCCGLFFLKQAYQDSRLLDFDYYSIVFDKVKRLFNGKKGSST